MFMMKRKEKKGKEKKRGNMKSRIVMRRNEK